MTRDEIKQRIHQELGSYLTRKGLPLHTAFRCLSPTHEDKHPSMRYSDRYHNVRCFACGQTYDIFDLIGMDYHLDSFPAQFDKACDLFGYTDKPKKSPRPKEGDQRTSGSLRGLGHRPSVTPYLAAAHARIAQTDYPALRGLSPETTARFRLGYDPAFTEGTGGRAWQALIIPTGPENYTARNINPGESADRVRKHGGTPIFCQDVLYEDGPPVFVVEGELDAISVYEAGGEAVALGGTPFVKRFVNAMREKPPKRTLLIAMDNDDSGAAAARDLCEGLAQLGIPHHRVDLTPRMKDANEALLHDREGLCATIESLRAIEDERTCQEKEAYLAARVDHYMDAFIGGLSQQVDTPFIPTGFARLDAHLDGGLFEGLYIVGAISSLGKTTFVLQMADQIALSGQDVLLVSLEMSRYELMAKSLSRETLKQALAQRIDIGFAKTARGITTASRWNGYSIVDRQLLHDAAEAYRPVGGHLFLHEGMGDIGAAHVRTLVEQHEHATGNTPVVIVDYLQILAPHNERSTDKQNMDRAVLDLKRISRDHKAAVVCISSFNRAGYREAVTMESFKESGAIEYSSDVLIGLQLMGAGEKDFDPNKEKDKEPRQVELVVLKNRNGATGKRVGFEYYPRFNYFRER